MRNVTIVPGEIYHIYNRGNRKQPIFNASGDYARLLFALLYFQSALPVSNPRRHVKRFKQNGNFDVAQKLEKQILDSRTVNLIAFALMPNHFHLILEEKEEGALSSYLMRVQDSYTKYFNIKHKVSGHLFQGPFGAVRMDDNNQLLYLSTYLHRQSEELKRWRGKAQSYPWSSYQDYILANRWNDLLSTQLILDEFKETDTYKRFTEESIAKSKEYLDAEILHPSPYHR